MPEEVKPLTDEEIQLVYASGASIDSALNRADWPEPETVRRLVARIRRDGDRIKRLRVVVESLRDEILWCSGSPDFNEGGQARAGWVKGPQRAMGEADAALAETGD